MFVSIISFFISCLFNLKHFEAKLIKIALCFCLINSLIEEEHNKTDRLLISDIIKNSMRFFLFIAKCTISLRVC